MPIQAIETVFDGYRFRSRLEARWAVFFKALRVPYEYEPEGVALSDGTRYLPDFWLPTLTMWAEVKPAPLTAKEERKARCLAADSECAVLRLIGAPRYTVYTAVCPPVDGAPYLGDIDYLLDDQYVDDEHRWYSSPELAPGEDASASFVPSERTRLAYLAAKQARFEHGESGAIHFRQSRGSAAP
jgi:hypothetical protein